MYTNHYDKKASLSLNTVFKLGFDHPQGSLFFFWLTLPSEAQSSLPIKNLPSLTGYSNLDKVGVCSTRIGICDLSRENVH